MKTAFDHRISRAAGTCVVMVLACIPHCAEPLVDGTFTAAEWAQVETLSPLPEPPDDPTNAYDTDPRAAVLVDVMAAAQLWSQDAVTEALRTSYNLPSLLDRLTSVLLHQLTPDQRSALEVTLPIGYWHPQMGTQPIASEQLRPWVVPMEQQWGWLRPIWVPPLRRELARPVGARHRRPGLLHPYQRDRPRRTRARARSQRRSRVRACCYFRCRPIAAPSEAGWPAS